MKIKFNNVFIRNYLTKDRAIVEKFRQQSFEEGNESLSFKKFDPDNIRANTLLFFIDGVLASLSVCEASHYTGDPDISARFCRHHILKKYRHCNAGFNMLPYHVRWAEQNKFKVIYWTADINRKALNAQYQHKRRLPGNQFFDDKLYRSFKLQKDFLFKVSSKSDLLQYVYSKLLQPNYQWIPKKNIVFVDPNNIFQISERRLEKITIPTKAHG